MYVGCARMHIYYTDLDRDTFILDRYCDPEQKYLPFRK